MNDTPTASDTTTYRSEPGGGPANPKTIRFVTLFIAGSLIATILLVGRSQMGLWYYAKARNAWEDKNYDEAVEASNTSLKWSPGRPEVVELRAVARMLNKDFEGCIADCDELLAEAAKDEKTTEADFAPLQRKANALQRLGRHKEALDIWTEIIEYRKTEFEARDDHDSRYLYAMALNNRAYMVAQAFVSAEGTGDQSAYDIAEALEQIELAMDVRKVADDSVMLDTLGYLRLLNGRPEEAIVELEKVVLLTRAEHKARKANIQRRMPEVKDQRPLQDEIAMLDEQYSIILHHRGEAYEALNQQEKADADLNEAKRLGYNPAEGIW